MAKAIAGGSSGSSEPRWTILPMQLLLVSPLLVPVWVAGLVRLFRADDARDVRFVGWAYVVLFVIFTVTGGKPYYLAQLSPTLLGIGAAPVDRWARTRVREVVLGAAIVLSLVIGGTVTLPVLPEADTAAVIDANYDAGETIGWHAFVDDVTRAVDTLPAGERANAVILTNNYGEAGALQRFGSQLPSVYSGHNSYGYWGPPPAGTQPVIAVGDLGGRVINGVLTGCNRVGTVNNGLGIENDEQGAPIYRCHGPRTSWTHAWPTIRFLG
jgi:hypothetical protein